MKKTKSGIISLILAILMLINSSISVFAAVTGSAIAPANPNRWSNTFGEFGEIGALYYRIAAFEIDGYTGGDYKYFTVSNSGHGDLISLTQNIVNTSEHKANDRWFYFSSINEVTRTYSFYCGGVEFTTELNGYGSEKANELKSALGISSIDITTLDSQLNGYTKIGTSDDPLARFFGIEEGKYYFVVIEGLRGVSNQSAPTNGTDYSAKFMLTTWQDYVFDSNTRISMNGLGNIGSYVDSLLSDVSRYINQGSIAPFGKAFAEGQPLTTGFAVYGDINGSTSEPVSLNIAVEYKGEPNTTDGEFVAASSLIKQEGSKYSYWDVSQNKWIESSDKASILQTTKGVDINDPYTVVLEDYYYIQNDVKNLTASHLINSGDTSNSGYTITWGNTQVNTGLVNVGYSIKPTALNGKQSTSAIIDKFTSVLNDGTIYNGRVENKNFSALSILEACIDNVNRAYIKTSLDAIGSMKANNEVYLRNTKQLGTAVELIVKGKDVTSRKVTVTVDASGNASASETWKETYSSAGSTSVGIASNAVCFVVVPNTFSSDSGVVGALNGTVDTNASSILNKVKGALTNVRVGQVASGLTIGLGCESNLDGYTVYEIIVADAPIKGTVELPAYMLNRYFKNIIQTSSLGDVVYNLNKDFTIVKENYTGSETCSRCSSVLAPINKPVDFDDWKIEWKDVSEGTPHVNYDNALRSRYFIKMNSGVWSHADRIELATWVSEDTRNWGSPSGYIMDYGFNLIRASSADNRAVSGINYPNYNAVDADNLLRLKDYFGVTPQPIKPASEKRNSKAVVGVVADTLTMHSRFTKYSGDGYNETVSTHSHDEEGHWTEATETTPSTYVVDNPAVSYSYYTFPSKSALGFRRNANATAVLEYTFESTIYKYETDVLATGKNSVLGDKTSAKVDTFASNVQAGAVKDGNEYRFANVRLNGVVHNFFPEVKMVTLIGGTDWNSVAEKAYQPIMTMGEVQRKEESSSLYLFKINGLGENAVSGTTYSDGALGGTSGRFNKKVTIPAGSDVYINAQPEGITIDLYGYALDIIDKTTDDTFKVSDTITREFESVVKSGVDVNSIWGNNPNKDILVAHFADYCNSILDVKNFAADFELYSGNNMLANNFSAVIGNIKRNNVVDEDGVYQLQVANGSLVKNTDYNCLIKQIAEDYDCSEGEAEAVFKASGIYTSILNAIESSNSSFNKSGITEVNSTWTSSLGNESNWYDEKVNTFVVRRFTNKGNQFKDITAVDKIDFGLSNNSNSSHKQNANADNDRSASWKLNIFFNIDRAEEVNNLLLDNGVYYNATSQFSSLDEANNNYTVLMRSVPIKDADFLISSYSTQDYY